MSENKEEVTEIATEEMPEAPQLERQVSIGSGSAETVESAVVNATTNQVWGELLGLSFSFWNIVESCEPAEGTHSCEVGGMHTLTFKDGSVWVIELRELSQLHNSLTFQVITAEPALSVSSVLHTLKVQRVTLTDQAFVTWSTQFSIDATGEILEDSRFKRQDALTDLASHFSS